MAGHRIEIEGDANEKTRHLEIRRAAQSVQVVLGFALSYSSSIACRTPRSGMIKLQLVVLGAALAGLSLVASAQEYPAKPIRVITPYGAGGASDIVVRAGVHEMSKQLGQGIVVENRTGAGATIGFEAFAASPPDGYTLLGTRAACTASRRPVQRRSPATRTRTSSRSSFSRTSATSWW
jgi:hypothetical protein